MKISKMRKVFPFYEQHGHLVYIGGVQRKLQHSEEDRLLNVLLQRKFSKAIKAFSDAVKGIDFSKIQGGKHEPLPPENE